VCLPASLLITAQPLGIGGTMNQIAPGPAR
jgi:hypothetical protein